MCGVAAAVTDINHGLRTCFNIDRADQSGT